VLSDKHMQAAPRMSSDAQQLSPAKAPNPHFAAVASGVHRLMSAAPTGLIRPVSIPLSAAAVAAVAAATAAVERDMRKDRDGLDADDPEPQRLRMYGQEGRGGAAAGGAAAAVGWPTMRCRRC
jgi:hypothetical protein